MKIKSVNTYLVRPRWGFVEICTDDGLCGWGEAVLEGHAATVQACVEEMSEYLIGADPRRIEDIWTTLYRAGFCLLYTSRGNAAGGRSFPGERPWAWRCM